MIITNKNVFLNFPKTGSSFVRTVIKEIHENRLSKNIIVRILHKIGIINIGYEELMMPHLNIPEYKDQHGTYNQIPMKHKSKTIISVVRNPYDRFLSLYTFQWWVSKPIISEKIIKEYCPSFPYLSIDEFAIYDQQLTNKFKKEYKIPIDVKIGGQTIEFIEMFFKNPTSVLNRITNEYLVNDEYKKDLMSITFLKQEDLNIDLAKILYKTGYNRSEVNLAKSFKKINVTDKKSKESGLTKEVFNYIQTTEILLFRILKNEGINY